MKSVLALAAVLTLVTGGSAMAQSATPAATTSAASTSATYTGANLAPQARITMVQARAIALRAHPGRITDAELENEGGGSGLRYSFDIRSGSRTHEVGVDARTGRVLENKAEGAHPD